MSVIQFVERLDNGMTILGEQHPGAYSVSFSLLLPLGAVHDPVSKLGTSTLTQDVLYKGAGDWDAQALATQIDQIGFQESHLAERELVTFSGTILPKHLERALDLTHTVLNAPQLPEEGLEEARQLALYQLMAMEDAPAQKMFYELGQRFFPAPLANPAEGKLDTLPAITIDDVKSFWQRYTPAGALLSVAGAFEKQALMDHLEKGFASWKGDPVPEPELKAPSRTAEHVEQDTEQMQIGIAFDSVPLSHPDYFKARVGVMALSSGMSSRLFVEVRQKRGLAYSVFATYLTTKTFGGVLGYAGTSTERAQETLDVLLAEFRRLEQGITDEELEKAKTKLKTNFIVQGESTRSRAEAMVRERFYADKVWTLDEVMHTIDTLSLEDVNGYLADAIPAEFTILTLGKRKLEVPS